MSRGCANGLTPQSGLEATRHPGRLLRGMSLMLSQLGDIRKFRGPKQLRMVVRSSQRLREFILNNLERFDLISFDVFDTLLERRLEPPDLVKEQSAAFLSKYLQSLGVQLNRDEIVARRNTIENRLRRLAVEQGFDAECSLAELAEKLVADCAGATISACLETQIAAEFVRHELESERQTLSPHPEMAALFAELLRNNKRVILSSDMCLAADQIRSLLSANGLPVGDVPLYVSGDLKVCKGTGRLYRHWIESEGVDPGRAIHIGDNAECDFVAALSVGLSAIHFAPPASQTRKQRLLKLHHRAAGNDFSKGKYSLALCEQVGSHPLQNDFFFRYGSQFLGPVFAVTMHRLVEQVREYGIQQLLFAAREGFIFKKIYEQFAQGMLPHERRPDTVYAYFSRHSTALASVQRLSLREVERCAVKPKRGGLAEVLSAYGLPQEPFAAIAAEHGLGMDEPIRRTDEPRLVKFLSDHRVQSAVGAASALGGGKTRSLSRPMRILGAEPESRARRRGLGGQHPVQSH